MNSEISINISQFPENEEGHSVLVRCPFLHNINALFEIIVHSLGVEPSTKWTEIGLFERAS